MGKYYTPQGEADADEFALARHFCLGHPLPEHVNIYAHLDACEWDFWRRYERELLALLDGEDKPRSWHQWQTLSVQKSSEGTYTASASKVSRGSPAEAGNRPSRHGRKPEGK